MRNPNDYKPTMEEQERRAADLMAQRDDSNRVRHNLIDTLSRVTKQRDDAQKAARAMLVALKAVRSAIVHDLLLFSPTALIAQRVAVGDTINAAIAAAEAAGITTKG